MVARRNANFGYPGCKATYGLSADGVCLDVGGGVAGLYKIDPVDPGPPAIGDVVFESVADTIRRADASLSAKMPAIGMVTQITPTVKQGYRVVALGEVVVPAAMQPLVAGADYYVSDTTPGAITDVAPSALGSIVQRIGYAKDTTTLVLTCVGGTATANSSTSNVDGIYKSTEVGPPSVLDVVYVAFADDAYKALADGSGQAPGIGFVVSIDSSVSPNLYRVRYEGELGGFVGLTPGAAYYLSSTVPGGITLIAPAPSPPAVVQVVGIAKDTTTMIVLLGLAPGAVPGPPGPPGPQGAPAAYAQIFLLMGG